MQSKNRCFSELSDKEKHIFLEIALKNNSIDIWIMYMKGEIAFDKLQLLLRADINDQERGKNFIP